MFSFWKKLLLTTAVLVTFVNFIFFAGEIKKSLDLGNAKPGFESIKSERLLQQVSYFSSEKLQGRLAGSRGFRLASDYVAKNFAALKLKPKATDGFFQNLTLEFNEILSPMRFAIISKNQEIQFEPGKDFVARGFSGSGKLRAPVVFCGYGLSFPAQGYDDYKDVDVFDKVVLVFKQGPPWKIPNVNVDEASLPRPKAITAHEHGAIGMILVSTPNSQNVQGLIGSVYHGGGKQVINFPQIHISQAAAGNLLENSGHSLSQLQTQIDSTQKPWSFDLQNQAAIEIHARYDTVHASRNVVGILEGSDAQLKNEYVVIGAHLDHVGQQGEILFPGANDNASGSAALLEIAKAFTKNPVLPKRSIVFVAFTSEEQGLDGSSYFVANSPIPKDKIIAMVNMDCIGVGDSIQVGGGKSNPELHQLALNWNDLVNNLMTRQTGNGGGADATAFFANGIPTLYFVTTNSYPFLHLPGDKVETLNPKLFESVARLAYLTLWQLANSKEISVAKTKKRIK